MSKIFHIVNGDIMADILSKSSIQGDIIVWREMLCEGALNQDVGGDNFWLERYNYFENEVGLSRLAYFDKTIKEIQRIEELTKNSEVVLWFEFDLFCQVSLLAICTYLFKFYRKDIKYSLISIGDERGVESPKPLSEYRFKDYENLLKNKVNLSRNNFLFALECWNLYVENDEQKLKDFNFNKSLKFPYLQLAMNQHQKRFVNGNGLSQIDEKILNVINSCDFTKNEIIKELLQWQRRDTIYGFGDLQYEMALDKLKNYYTIENDIFVLNEKGKAKLR